MIYPLHALKYYTALQVGLILSRRFHNQCTVEFNRVSNAEMIIEKDLWKLGRGAMVEYCKCRQC